MKSPHAIRIGFCLLLCNMALIVHGQTNPTVKAPAATNSAATNSIFETYILGPQDKIQFRVEEDPVKSTESQTLSVSSIGEISVPVSVGFEEQFTVTAKGKTLAELQREIKSKLEADYYQKATVRLRLVDQSRRLGQVLFLGETRGVLNLAPGEQKSLAQAIAQLGYSEFANLKKVQLYRVDPVTQKPLPVIIVDVDAVLNKGDRDKDYILRDDDRVKVPEKGFLFK